jgi:hypothetical protein
VSQDFDHEAWWDRQEFRDNHAVFAIKDTSASRALARRHLACIEGVEKRLTRQLARAILILIEDRGVREAQVAGCEPMKPENETFLAGHGDRSIWLVCDF